MLKPDLILCLGNEVLTDDGFGAVVSRRLLAEGGLRQDVEVIFAPVAGFALLDLLADRERVLIVDTIQTGKSAPGTLKFFEMGTLVPANHLINSHQMSLPTALELGRRMQLAMPATVDVLAVEVEDIETLSEELTPRVADAVQGAIEAIQTWTIAELEDQTDGEDRETILADVN